MKLNQVINRAVMKYLVKISHGLYSIDRWLRILLCGFLIVM